MRSCDVTYKIKQDGFVGGFRMIDFSAERLAQEIATPNPRRSSRYATSPGRNRRRCVGAGAGPDAHATA
jgi:hypothetical protein